MNGPDQVLAGEGGKALPIKTSVPEGLVRLRGGQGDDLSSVPPLSVPTLLRLAAESMPNHLALSVKRNGKWLKWTYKQYFDDSRTVAKAFISLGLERFHSVGILGFNAPEWFIAQSGAIFAGGFSAGIYTTNSAEACMYQANNSRANILVVEDEKQLGKIMQIRSELTHLKAIVQYQGTPTQEGVLSWEDLLQLGSKESDDLLEERLKQIAINQCCALIYTSGTTGQPKGVMLSHDNLTWTARTADTYLSVTSEDSFISYLPLSHSAAQMIDVFMPMAAKATVYFADKNALKGSLVNTLREVRPTFFFGVPRIYEKIQEKMQEIGKSANGLRRAVADWAKKTGLHHNLKALENPESTSNGYSYPIAKRLVFTKVKNNLGFDRCRILGVGAAPMTRETFEYFLSLDIPIYECYGMSETSGPQTGNKPGKHRLGSVGPTLDGFITRILDPDPDGHGEVIMNSRNIMMGYLFSPEKTQEALDDDGWLHSGDIGREMRDGYYEITGRIKEILITAGGENVPPVHIEELIKKELPCISNVMVIGDKRKFLSALLTLKVDVDQDTLEPKKELSSATIDWCREIGAPDLRTIDEAFTDDKVKKAIQVGMDRANAQAISNAQKVQKWLLLPNDFSVPGGELGPTLKLKRHYVLKKYDTQINNFYNC